VPATLALKSCAAALDTVRRTLGGLEEFVHVGCGGGGVRKGRHAEGSQGQTQQALMLIQGRGLVAPLGLRAHDDTWDAPAAVPTLSPGLVEHDDQ